jgi:hypothetical protein
VLFCIPKCGVEKKKREVLGLGNRRGNMMRLPGICLGRDDGGHFPLLTTPPASHEVLPTFTCSLIACLPPNAAFVLLVDGR